MRNWTRLLTRWSSDCCDKLSTTGYGPDQPIPSLQKLHEHARPDSKHAKIIARTKRTETNGHHPEGSLFLATDDREAIRAFRSRYDTRRLAFQRGVPRGTCDIRGSCEYSNPMSRARTSTDGVAPLGDSVLIDALLLGRCDFLVKSKSAVSEFAIYFSPRLHNASYDFELNGQPLPVDRKA